MRLCIASSTMSSGFLVVPGDMPDRVCNMFRGAGVEWHLRLAPAVAVSKPSTASLGLARTPAVTGASGSACCIARQSTCFPVRRGQCRSAVGHPLHFMLCALLSHVASVCPTPLLGVCLCLCVCCLAPLQHGNGMDCQGMRSHCHGVPAIPVSLVGLGS